LDLVITPGVAFDKKGNRLGRGKGYYDRFLSKIPKDTPSIGLAFNLQVLPAVPVTSQDVSVKKVIFA
jgi:5-formyltetrahydrofolate cyclo-ligase